MRTLHIQQKFFKITDHYGITDEEGNVWYKVDQDFKVFGTQIHLSDASGKELFLLQQEKLFFLPSFGIHFSDGRKLTIQSRFKLFKLRLDVLPESEEITIEGDFLSHSFVITRHGEQIASIEKAYLSIGDSYRVTTNKREDEPLVLALLMATDRLIDYRKNNH